MPKQKPEDISRSLEKLEQIVRWLDEQERVDVQEGLRKVKEGAELVKSLRTRLTAVSNEFEEVKKGLEEDEPA